MSNERLNCTRSKIESSRCSKCDKSEKEKSTWKNFLSYLSSWMKGANPTCCSIEATKQSSSKLTPVVMCRAHTPISSGHQDMNKCSSLKKCSKRPSCELLISKYDFDNSCTDQKSLCEGIKSVCGKDTERSACNVQVEMAEVSAKNSKSCTCSKNKVKKTSSNSSCQQSLLEQAWEYLQSIMKNHQANCKRCQKRPKSEPTCPHSGSTCPSHLPPCPKSTSPCPSTNSTCPSKFPPRCPSPKSPCPITKSTCPSCLPPCPNNRSCPSTKSTCPSVLPPCPSPKAPCPSYLPSCSNSMTPCPTTKSTCPNSLPPCPNSPSPCPSTKSTCPNSLRPCPDPKPVEIYRRTSRDSECCKESMLDMVKTYLSKLKAAHQNECQRCKQQRMQHIATSFLRNMVERTWCYMKGRYEQYNTCQKQGVKPCSTPPPPPGILKNRGQSSCPCPGELQKNLSCEGPVKVAVCHRHPEETTRPVPFFKSKEEGTHEHKSCNTIRGAQNSQGVQLPNIFGYQPKSFGQIPIPRKHPLLIEPGPPAHEEPDTDVPCVKVSSQNLNSCNMKDTVTCPNDLKDTVCKPSNPKKGFSFTFGGKCPSTTPPPECKKSKESLAKSQRSCSVTSHCSKECTGPRSVLKEVAFGRKGQAPTSETCTKCDSDDSSSPMCEVKMARDYEKFLGKQFGQLVAKQLMDGETSEAGCSCKDSDAPKKDPHNYRFYF